MLVFSVILIIIICIYYLDDELITIIHIGMNTTFLNPIKASILMIKLGKPLQNVDFVNEQ